MGREDMASLCEEWESLISSGRRKEAEELYWRELFPLVRKAFRQRCKDFTGRYDALIMTVGTTPQPLILTLDAVRPRRVFFIYTSDTEAHLAKVIREVDFLRDHEVQYDREKVDPDDPEEIYEKIGRRWQEWSREGELNCALDNTGGKKSMVSAAAAAANFLGIDLLYVDHRKYLPDFRIPLPGTEYLTHLPNPYITLGDLKIRQCLDLFNAGSFESAEEKLKEAGEEIKGKRALPVVARVNILHDIVRGFSLWDRFHYGLAHKELKKALESARRYELDLDIEGLEKNLVALEALSREGRGGSFFGILSKHPDFGLRLAVDLYCNASRRERAGAPDDAAVRLYRCLELISQLRLAQTPGVNGRGFGTERFEWDNVPQAVKARYEQLARAVFGHDYVRTPRDVALMHGHLLLAAFGDPLWRKADEEDLRAFHKTVNKRNDLMLIHGTRRAKPQDVEEFTGWVGMLLDGLARLMGEDLGDLLDQHTFISL
ncbi:MAG: TIGR02710 family CRISPR-associated protein [Actinobacteria bacterium]|nr:TIGR02710 family CRISPR-associated protein [Actinomycetota bacterium]